MAAPLTVGELRSRQIYDRIVELYRFRLLALPLVALAAVTLFHFDADARRTPVALAVFVFEYAVAVFFWVVSRRRRPTRGDLVWNVLALALGGATLIYVTGDLWSPFLPGVAIPAVLTSALYAEGIVGYVFFAPLVIIGLLVSAVLSGALPRFEPLFASYPGWQALLRGLVITVVAVQAWRITRWLSASALDLAGRLGEANEELAGELEARQRADGVFVGQLAHELRNPLASIKSLHALVREHPENPANAKHAAIIAAEIDRLEKTLDASLNFGRPADPGRKAYFDLREPLESALRILQAKAERRGVSMVVGWSDQFPFKGDEQAFRQVFFNLLNNALDATERGGEIRVRSERVEHRYRITMADTGTGMAPGLAAAAFEPYVTGRTDGTGLGLSIVRQIVRGHGGEVSLASEPGKGTTVTLDLPAGGST
jgi:signal transduction histidine kinase